MDFHSLWELLYYLKKNRKKLEAYIKSNIILSVYSEESSLYDNLNGKVNVLVYLDTNDEENVMKVKKAIYSFRRAFWLIEEDDFPDVYGSWFKRWVLRFSQITRDKAFKDKMQEIEYVLRQATVEKFQAENDNLKGLAAAEVIKSISNVQNAAIVIGTIIVIKVTGDGGESEIFSYTLTAKDLMLLKKNPDIIKKPHELLKELNIETNSD